MNSNTAINNIKDKINELDLDSVTKRLTNKYKWSLQDAKQCEKLYRNFLYLHHKYGNETPLVPTDEIDLYWHEHILNTKKYIKDCNYLFNNYLHHEQELESSDGYKESTELHDLFEKTQEYHKKEFGYYMYDIKISFKYLLKVLKFKIFKKISK